VVFALDMGSLVAGAKYRGEFRHKAVIIMTSKIGSTYLLDGVTPDGEIRPENRELVMAELRGHFRPEFLNRVDDIILFKPKQCPHGGKKNRVPAPANGVPRCGNCHQPLPWIAEAGDSSWLTEALESPA
jgi:AAA domain (Cdc48 subfamily)